MKQLLMLLTFTLLNSQSTRADGLLPVEYIDEGVNYNNQPQQHNPPPQQQYNPPQQQYQNGMAQACNPQIPFDYAAADAVLAASSGTCDARKNPHTIACNHLSFIRQGRNGFFPYYNVDWNVWAQDSWVAVTYVGASDSHSGPEFTMAVNPYHQSQPMGVYNTVTNLQVGSMTIDPYYQSMRINNWNGRDLVFEKSSYVEESNYIVTWVWIDPSCRLPARYQGGQSWSCRWSENLKCVDFNRNNKHHMNCQWSTTYRTWPNYQYDQIYAQDRVEFKGYIGFLFRTDWENFLPKRTQPPVCQ